MSFSSATALRTSISACVTIGLPTSSLWVLERICSEHTGPGLLIDFVSLNGASMFLMDLPLSLCQTRMAMMRGYHIP